MFIRLDASKVPHKQRHEYAALAVRRSAPFPDPEFDAAWAPDGTAAIWYWSRARATSLVAGEPAKRVRFVAEGPYVGHPRDMGVELLCLEAGFEARVWKEGKLYASRWWAQAPSHEQWKELLRGAGVQSPAAIELPEPIVTEHSLTPWNRQPIGVGALQFSGIEQHLPRVVLVAAAVALLGAGLEVGAIVRARIEIWQAAAASARLDAPLKRILAAREATDLASAEIDQILSLHELRPTISLMAEFTRLMPGDQWRVKRWSQPTPTALEITLVAPGSNPESLVSTLEGSSMFASVTTELGRNNEIVVRATVTASPTRHAGLAP